MTTLLHKTNAYKKVRPIGSGFWEIIKAFVPHPRQGLASEYISVGFTQCKEIGGGPCVITCTI